LDEQLRSTIKAETAYAYRYGRIDIPILMKQCPCLEAVYNESLRITNGAFSGRKITGRTVIGGKVLEPGHTIVIPFRQLHMNQDTFGDDPTAFDPERFLKNPSLTSSGSFKLFGGGTSYCPGRFVVKQEMMFFVALVLNRFDAKLSPLPNQEFPELDMTVPALGINVARKGQDVLIDLHA
jgi:cytochrome P450